MNINLTFFVQIFNILTTMFLLKKILIDKILEVIKIKKAEIDILNGKVLAKQTFIKELEQQDMLLWNKFKERNNFAIENNIEKGAHVVCNADEYESYSDKELSSVESDQVLASKIAKKFSSKIIKNISQTP